MPQPAQPQQKTPRMRGGFMEDGTTFTLSIEKDLLAFVRREAAGKVSVSQWLCDAADAKRKRILKSRTTAGSKAQAA